MCENDVDKMMKSTEVLNEFYDWLKDYKNNRDNNSTPNCEARLLTRGKECNISVVVTKNNGYSTLYISIPDRKMDEELKEFTVLVSNDSKCAFRFQTDSDPAKSFLQICKGSKEIKIMKPC